MKLSNTPHWYVLARTTGKSVGTAVIVAGPYRTNAAALLGMQQRAEQSKPYCEYTIADIRFPGDGDEVLDHAS